MSERTVVKRQRELMEERKEIEAEITPKLKRVGDRIFARAEQSLQGALKTNWQNGKDIMDVLEGDKDQIVSRRLIYRYLVVRNMSPRYLDMCLSFYRSFTNEEDRDFIFNARLQIRQTPLTWHHITLLLQVNDMKELRKLTEQCCSHEWSVSELQNAVEKLLGRTEADRHGGGRPVRVPPSLSGKLANLNKIVGFVPRNTELIYRHPEHGILKSLEDLPADKITPEFIASIEKAENVVQEAGVAIEALQADLQQALAKATERFQKQAELAARQTADALDGTEKKGKK